MPTFKAGFRHALGVSMARDEEYELARADRQFPVDMSGLTFVKIDQTGSAGVTTIASAVAGKKVYLMSLVGTMEASGTLTIEDSDGTDLSGPMPLGANGGMAVAGGVPFVASGEGKGLRINTSQKFYGVAGYVQE